MTAAIKPLVPEASPPPDLIADAIARLKDDAGAVFEQSVLDLLRQARENDPAGWARYRQAIKVAGVVSMGELDKLTSATTHDVGGNEMFPEVTLWPDAVDGAALLQEVAQTIRQHVIADPATINAAALWAAFTWLIDVVDVAPIANITAPEKRCGKTVLLAVLARLSCRALTLSNIAPAALFRAIEMWSAALFIDEVDTFLSDYPEARGILNAGFTRDSAYVIRCVGDDHAPTRFNVWGAKALCGIGKIADTLADRSIPLRLRRKLPGEHTIKIRHADPEVFADLSAKLARFAIDNRDAIRVARPAEIEGMNDRANDCWEPLLAVAEVAGGDWPRLARQAAIALHGLEGEAPSINAELLADVKATFDTRHTDRLSSAELLTALCEDDEAPWATWNRGRPMTARQFSARLKEFGAKSAPIRFGYGVAKGYRLDQLDDAFERYLSASTPAESVTRLQPSNHAGLRVTEGIPVTVTENPSVTPEPSNHAACNRVTDKTPLPADGREPAFDETDEEAI